VMSAQTLRISVSADESVRSVFVISGYPMPNARPLGDNQFEIVIPKTLPSGKYNLTAVGATSTPVESAQVTIQVEREDPANFCRFSPRSWFSPNWATECRSESRKNLKTDRSST
jgi:hypothetical protein